jgi:hypothetical protein
MVCSSDSPAGSRRALGRRRHHLGRAAGRISMWAGRGLACNRLMPRCAEVANGEWYKNAHCTLPRRMTGALTIAREASKCAPHAWQGVVVVDQDHQRQLCPRFAWAVRLLLAATALPPCRYTDQALAHMVQQLRACLLQDMVTVLCFRIVHLLPCVGNQDTGGLRLLRGPACGAHLPGGGTEGVDMLRTCWVVPTHGPLQQLVQAEQHHIRCCGRLSHERIVAGMWAIVLGCGHAVRRMQRAQHPPRHASSRHCSAHLYASHRRGREWRPLWWICRRQAPRTGQPRSMAPSLPIANEAGCWHPAPSTRPLQTAAGAVRGLSVCCTSWCVAIQAVNS